MSMKKEKSGSNDVTKSSVLLEILQFHTDVNESMTNYKIKFVDRFEEYVMNHDIINNENKCVLLVIFNKFKDVLMILRKIRSEIQDNCKDDNLYGPLSLWYESFPEILSQVNLFFYNMVFYEEKVKRIIGEVEHLKKLTDKLSEDFGMSYFEYHLGILRYPRKVLPLFQKLLNTIPTGNKDYYIVLTLIKSVNESNQKIEASAKDGVPEKCSDYSFSVLEEDVMFGKICEAYRSTDNTKFKAHIISKVSKNSIAYMDQINILMQAHKELRHRNLMIPDDSFEDELFYYLLYPYTEGMELSSILRRGGKLSEEAMRPIFRQIMRALQHLHSNRYNHNFICLDKIMFFKGRVIIFDFTRCNYSMPDEEASEFCPPIYYCSPEVFKKKKFNGKDADIWAAGCCLYEMLTMKKPFNGKTIDIIKEKILRNNIVYPKEFSPLLVRLFKGIFSLAPESRFTIHQILSHPWFKKTAEVTVRNTILYTPHVSLKQTPFITRPRTSESTRPYTASVTK